MDARHSDREFGRSLRSLWSDTPLVGEDACSPGTPVDGDDISGSGPASRTVLNVRMILVQQLSVHELAAKRDTGEPVYLLDVRQPWEHALAALPGSVLIPLPELPRRAAEIQPSDGALVV